MIFSRHENRHLKNNGKIRFFKQILLLKTNKTKQFLTELTIIKFQHFAHHVRCTFSTDGDSWK
jgi:hypothetical protein